MSEVRLQVRNMTKHFGINRALNNVSFDVNKGDINKKDTTIGINIKNGIERNISITLL